MIRIIKNLLNKSIIKYFLCSGATAVIEFILLFILKNVFTEIKYGLIVANTAAIFTGAVVHYIITSKYVFEIRTGIKSAAVYIATFFAGLFIQNTVLWLCYNYVVNRFISNDNVLTLVCKIISLAASFFITYLLRLIINGKLKERENNE